MVVSALAVAPPKQGRQIAAKGAVGTVARPEGSGRRVASAGGRCPEWKVLGNATGRTSRCSSGVSPRRTWSKVEFRPPARLPNYLRVTKFGLQIGKRRQKERGKRRQRGGLRRRGRGKKKKKELRREVTLAPCQTQPFKDHSSLNTPLPVFCSRFLQSRSPSLRMVERVGKEAFQFSFWNGVSIGQSKNKIK